MTWQLKLDRQNQAQRIIRYIMVMIGLQVYKKKTMKHYLKGKH